MSLSIYHEFDPSHSSLEDNPLFRRVKTSEQSESGYIYKSKIFNEITQNQEIPEVIRSLLNQYCRTNRVKTTLTRHGEHYAFQIKFEGVEQLTKYYNEKYGISIKPILLQDLFKDIESCNSEPKEGPQAYIVHSSSNIAGEIYAHVTPILCEKTRDGITVVSLDVFGAQAGQQYPFEGLLDLCRAEKASCFQLEEARQADNYTCATDAVLVLRNALLDTRRRRERGESCELMSRVTRLSGNFISVPAEWIYTSQITPKVFKEAGGIQGDIPRDFYSHDKTKKIDPKNLSHFREPHSREVEIDYRLELVKSRLYRLFCNSDEFQQLGENEEKRFENLRQMVLPPCLEKEDDKHSLSFRYHTSRRENHYIQQKNHAFARHLTDPSLPKRRQKPEVLPLAQKQTIPVKSAPKRSQLVLSRPIIFATTVSVVSLVAGWFFTGDNFNRTMIALGLREEPSTFSNCYGYCN